ARYSGVGLEPLVVMAWARCRLPLTSIMTDSRKSSREARSTDTTASYCLTAEMALPLLVTLMRTEHRNSQLCTVVASVSTVMMVRSSGVARAYRVAASVGHQPLLI